MVYYGVLWFLAIFSTSGLDRYRNIFIKNDQPFKRRLLRGHSDGFEKIQSFNPLPQLFLSFPELGFCREKIFEQ